MGIFGNNKNIQTIENTKSRKLFCVDFENTSDKGLIGINLLEDSDEVVIFYGSTNNSISFVSHEMIVNAKCKVTIFKCDKCAKNYLDFQLVSFIGKRLGKDTFSNVVIVSKDMGYDSVVDFWKKEGINISRQTSIDKTIVERSSASRNRKSNEQIKVTKNNNEQNKTSKAASMKKEKEDKTEKKFENKNVKIKNEIKPSEKNKKQITTKGNENQKSLPEEYRKKIRNNVKKDELKPTQYTIVYNVFLKSKNEEEYTKNISKRLGGKSKVIIEHTIDIFREYVMNN